MKHLLILSSFICLLTLELKAQWDVNFLHAAFRINNTIDESTHWTPGDISFWTNTSYQTGVTLTPTSLRMFDNPGGVGIDRIRLDYDGLVGFNGGAWQTYKLGLNGSQGQLELTNGTGLVNTNITGGTGRFYGSDGSENVYIGFVSGTPGNGYVNVKDQHGALQAGIYVDAFGNGQVFGDTKTFKVDHPLEEDKDIWYACIEGPEAAIYERGSATLKNGETFVKYSEHYASMVGNGKMTIQLTPQHWDTYGLAVTKKTKEGFYVKELKSGRGNFAFDWEVKSVRKGKEDFQVIRSKDFLKNLEHKEIIYPELPKSNMRNKNMKHHQGCVHHPNGH